MMSLPKTPEELVSMDTASWQLLLQDPNQWQNIPLLNHTPLHKLKDQTLVRFRGMVQDMMDQEIYLERYGVKSADGIMRLQQGKYRDCLNLDKDEQVDYDNVVHGERRTLFVVSVPGLNDWAKQHEHKCNVQEDEPMVSNSHGVKRVLQEESSEEQMEVDSHKRQCLESPQQLELAKSNATTLAASYLLNSPLPERPSMACMVKVYENFDNFSLNSLLDFVGFLSVHPALDAALLEADTAENLTELAAQHPSPLLIPRLHAFGVQPLPHANPLLDRSLQQPSVPATLPAMASLHKDLRMLLKLCLFDDELAADYLICHLISTVYSRSELQSIGKCALNLCNLPKSRVEGYARQLSELLALLLPASHYLPMSLDTLNTAAFAPKKDYETSKLVSGLLQLAPHTHLILDETCLQQGKLEASGVQAVQHLANLINHQQLKCDFQYYHIDYNVDIPVLIFSEGRSMLPSDFVLPLNADSKAIEIHAESMQAAQHYLQPERLQQLRSYLTLARTASYNVSDALTEQIQQDFVQMRQANAKSNADDLHGLLVLSRLLGIARGQVELDKNTWDMAMKFEAQRRQRLQALPKSQVSN
ncbi:CG3430 [Drosophila busckii]|uniref:Mini-chromosome maintenance complex-binding protein n=1 Tax=Drosophila busckii TaxID=30019 RepID=A0A0M4E937_DROBS|nr:mini-chromosome maintenance complex-binding protein [Drosophila busckii]ALC38638.1 CG3430 [Drosophila busckii]